MDQQAILQVVLQARDEATKTLKGFGDTVDAAQKRTADMSTAFKEAGGVMLGMGIAGVGVMKMLADAAAQHQVAEASVDATLKNVSSSLQESTVVIGGATDAHNMSKKAIQEEIAALNLQKQQLTLNNAEQTQSVTVTTGHGKTLKEHTKIVHENAASINEQKLAIDQQIISLKQSELGVGKAGSATGETTKIVDNAAFSYANLKKATDQVAMSSLALGFSENESSLAFAQAIRVTKDMGDAHTMLQAAEDLSRLKHLDLNESTRMVTMAYEGNLRALKALGIELPKGAKGMETINALEQAAGGQAVAFSKTYEGAMQVLGVEFDKLKATLGDRLLPSMTQFITSIVSVVEKLNNLNPKTYDTIVTILKFGTVFSLIAAPILLFIGFLPALAAGFALVAGSLLPLTLILVGLGAAAYLLYTHWDQVSRGFQQFGTVVAPMVKAATDFITKTMQLFLADLEKFWKQHGAAIMLQVNQIWQKTVAAFQAIVAVVEPAMKGMLVIVEVIGFLIYDEFNKNWTKIQNLTQFIFDLIVAVIKVALDLVIGTIKIGTDIMSGNWSKAWTDMKTFVINIWNDIKTVIKDAINAVIGYINGLIVGANKLTAKLHLPQLGTIAPVSFDTGGYVPNTGLAMLHAGEFVLSKDMLAGKQPAPAAAAIASSPQITIYATINTEMDLNLLGQKIAFAVRNSR